MLSVAQAATVYVNVNAPGVTQDGASWQSAYRSVAVAVNAAAAGDQVWVAAGAYSSPVTIAVPNLSLLGGFSGTETDASQRDPRANPTHLSVWYNPTAANIIEIPVAGSGATIDGFLLDHSYLTGIACSATSVTVSNCRIEYTSGGLYCREGSSVTLRGCAITGMTQSSNSAVWAYKSDVSLLNCTITDNGWPGDNSVGSGVISISYGTAIIRNCLIARNLCYAEDYIGTFYGGQTRGGAIGAWNATITIANNTIVQNRAFGNRLATGGGVYLSQCTATLANNIFAENQALSGYYLGVGVPVDGGDIAFDTLPTLSDNCFYNNSRPNPQVVGVGGTITDNPLFINATAGEYRLLPESPVIDRGDDAYASPSDVDLAGHPRSIGAHVDLGAYEYTGSYQYTGRYAMPDVVRALRLIAGITPSNPYDPGRLDVAKGPSAGRIDLLDAIRLARKAMLLDSNP